MKSKYIYSLFFLLGLICCKTEPKLPILKFDKEVFDFGEIKNDSVLKVVFEYQNIGSDSLKILNTSVDCGCTSVEYDKNSIAPGEKRTIEVTYIPKSNSDSGLVSKNIALMTNTSSPIKIIKIRGGVKK